MSLLVLLALAMIAGHSRQEPKPASTNDLDRFMEQVLARREVNRRTLNDYVLDETESFEILGPGRAPLSRMKREYTWYVRDGMHVRSPVRFDGVAVGDEARDEYERKWIHRERERQERERKHELALHGADLGPGAIPTEPRFVSEAYFMEFKFEPGNYLLAGREKLEGHDVLRIEYYPTRLFSDRDEEPGNRERKSEEQAGKDTRADRREREQEADIERRMNKTALVTLWVDPEEHQIVKYTFDNVWLDFLPGAWLVRVDDIRASMTMGQPFPGVWLPREITVSGGATLASGSFEITLAREFKGYREANVGVKVRVPEVPKVPESTHGSRSPSETTEIQRHRGAPSLIGYRQSEGSTQPSNTSARLGAFEPLWFPSAPSNKGPALLEEDALQGATEIVGAVLVHGNAFLTDAEVLTIAGIEPGAVLGPDTVATVKKRLEDSRRFESVEVRKRYRSLTDPSDIALVLIVHERPGVRSGDVSNNPVPGAFSRLRSQLMFLPILNYADGYGFTYGARLATVDLLGADERLSVPLTWGGTKRAALEFERAFDRGPLTRVTSSIGIWNRENPRFDLDEQRIEFRAGAERRIGQIVKLGVDTSRSSVEFGTLDEPQWTIGTSVALDTRADPAFPANAVYIGGGWTGLHVQDHSAINRYTAEARGYLRIFRQHILAARAQYQASDAALPQYERLLLGGAPTLRGFRAGAFDGDRMLITSAELRLPITSVISGARLGATVFTDAAKIADHGSSLSDARWRQGAGAGLFLVASVIKLNLDVAHGFDGGGTRVHFSTGFLF